jgi:hypothetical protein
MTSEQCRHKAEQAEMMARAVSYRLDRNRYAKEASDWRGRQAQALALEHKRPA